MTEDQLLTEYFDKHAVTEVESLYLQEIVRDKLTAQRELTQLKKKITTLEQQLASSQTENLALRMQQPYRTNLTRSKPN